MAGSEQRLCDALGLDALIASLTDGNSNTTGFTPDGFDRLSTTTYPDSSIDVLGYDADGNVLTRQTRAGATISFSYDTLNRLSTKAAPSEPTVSYGYDLASHLIGVSDNGAGIAAPASSASYTTTLAYDQLNRPDGADLSLKVRSMVGLIPLFGVETLEPGVLDCLPSFKKRLDWFIDNRPDLCGNVASMRETGIDDILARRAEMDLVGIWLADRGAQLPDEFRHHDAVTRRCVAELLDVRPEARDTLGDGLSSRLGNDALLRLGGGQGILEIEHPSGKIAIDLDADFTNGRQELRRAALVRTARRVFEGSILVPSRVWAGKVDETRKAAA